MHFCWFRKSKLWTELSLSSSGNYWVYYQVNRSFGSGDLKQEKSQYLTLNILELTAHDLDNALAFFYIFLFDEMLPYLMQKIKLFSFLFCSAKSDKKGNIKTLIWTDILYYDNPI